MARTWRHRRVMRQFFHTFMRFSVQHRRRPLQTILTTIGIVMGALLFTSCEDAGNTPVDETSRVRLLHMAYDAPNVDLRIDGAVVAAGVSPLQSSGFESALSGARRISVSNAGASAELLTATETLKKNTDYTVITFPPAAAVSGALVEEPRLIPTGSAIVRMANATTDGGSLELRTATGSSAFVGPTGQASVSAAVETPAASQILRLYQGQTLLAEYAPLSLLANTSYTMVVYGTVQTTDDVPLRVRVFTASGDGEAYTELESISLLANVMVVNALVGAQTVDAVVDGTVLSSGITFGTATSYLGVQPGKRLFAFSRSGTPVISTETSFDSRSSYTVFGTGTLIPPDVAPIVLKDVTTPNAAQALVRFVNAAPDAGTVDVITPLGMTDYEIPGMQGVAFREVSTSTATGSNFLQIPASPADAPYLLKIRKTGTTTMLTTLENVKLEAGKIYTLWIGGRASDGSLAAYLIKHEH
ncbi:MAG: DUF4397 domain-containing protein [Candidatus Kapabacteria bacterium]|nr:DUF4397 domain-containing protein [Candidatus Kapabacteria bacterium]